MVLAMDPDGEHDWMDPEGGVQCVERLKAAGNNKARFYIVDKAGHHGTCPLVGASVPLLPRTRCLD